MAEQLSTSTPGHNGIQVLRGVDQTQFLTWLDEMRELDQRVAATTADRKKKLQVIKAELGGEDEFQAFQRARKDAEMSGEARERRELAYRQLMFWQAMPVGINASLGQQSGEQTVPVSVPLLKSIDRQGEASGKAGDRRESNPYTPGTEQAQRWDSAWLRGTSKLGETAGTAAQAPKRRGRPPKSATRAAPAADEELERQPAEETGQKTLDELVH